MLLNGFSISCSPVCILLTDPSPSTKLLHKFIICVVDFSHFFHDKLWNTSVICCSNIFACYISLAGDFPVLIIVNNSSFSTGLRISEFLSLNMCIQSYHVYYISQAYHMVSFNRLSISLNAKVKH